MLSFFYRDSVYGTGTFHYTDIGKIFIEFNGKYTVYIVFAGSNGATIVSMLCSTCSCLGFPLDSLS